MNGDVVDLKTRTKKFALHVIRLYSALPKTTEAEVIGKQLLRTARRSAPTTARGCSGMETPSSSASSKAASKNWKRPPTWLELLVEADLVPSDRLADLQSEAGELTAILIACVKNAKNKK